MLRSNSKIFQPSFSPGGRLTFASDRSGWWNLYQLGPSGVIPLCPREAEFAWPQWVFGMSSYAYLGDGGSGAILCCYATRSGGRLARLGLDDGVLRDLDLPFTSYQGICVEGGRAAFLASSPTSSPTVCSLDLASGSLREHRASSATAVDRAFISVPESITFPSEEGAHAYAHLYRPTHPSCSGPAGNRPPLIVKSHGGPTAAASTALDLRVQYWTSRGFAVVDVDYRGSSGYGRAYREQLRGQWGIADVADCVNAARVLAEWREVDPERCAISGGSAGGYTTLCALTFSDLFRAGASHYGIGDLEALVRDTHKFEARYLDGLVGPYPECRDLYVERSPIHHTERLSCPVIFFQGLEDRVVPPNQAEAMVSALAKRGIPHAYVPFEGEQHGFRRGENICAALEGELFFYGRIFGFESGVEPSSVEIVGL